MELFVEVAKCKGFRKAAESLDIPASTLSRRLSALEKSIGLRLIRRTTRNIELTEAGQVYYERSKPIVEEARRAHMQLDSFLSSPAGVLRVSLPADFAIYYMSPIISKFLEEHPRLSFELDLTPKRVDLVSDPWDLALRMGEQPASGMVARYIISVPRYLYASADYLAKHGEPTCPKDLVAHQCLAMNTPQESSGWTLVNGTAREFVKCESRCRVNSIGMLKALAEIGNGIAMLAPEVAQDAVEKGCLYRVLPAWEGTPIPVYALTETRLVPMKTMLFVDFIRGELRKNKNLICADLRREA